jgi:hypothetical protein
MEGIDTAKFPPDTRAWLEAKARHEGYASTEDLIREMVCRLHALDTTQQAKLEATLLERIESPAVEMSGEDWGQIREAFRRRLRESGA